MSVLRLAILFVVPSCTLDYGPLRPLAGADTSDPTGADPDGEFSLISPVAGGLLDDSSCSNGPFVDHDCFGRYSYLGGCGDGHITVDTEDVCPTCGRGDPEHATCDDAVEAYHEFIVHFVGESCLNWCRIDAECAAVEVTNACGTVMASLRSGIDDQFVKFSEPFAAQHCELCGTAEPTTIRATIGESLAAPGGKTYRPTCDESTNVCVLTEVQ